MNVAVVGCAHGELDLIYDAIEELARPPRSVKVELLLICGDFEAVRNDADLSCMAVPNKYRRLKTFHKYYSGERVAPVLTLFIGGNHEASNHLLELFHGGWVAPNIYYLGHAGVVQFGGLRVGGLTGIYKSHDYRKGHFEHPPYDRSALRSAYHTREFDVFQLMQLAGEAGGPRLDVFLSHDWPLEAATSGDTNKLLQRKPFFRDEIARNELGSPAASQLLRALQPSFWFSAHLHVKHAGVISHDGTERDTKFLGLDKAVRGRDFMQVLHFPTATDDRVLRYDAHWLAVLKATNALLPLQRQAPALPTDSFAPTEEQLAFVRDKFGDDLAVPHDFTQTAPTVAQQRAGNQRVAQPFFQQSPQTTALLAKLELDDALSKAFGRFEHVPLASSAAAAAAVVKVAANPEEIELDDEEDDE